MHYFHHLHFYLFIYTYPQSFMPSQVKYTQTKNDVIQFQFFDDIYLALPLFFHLILTRTSWLQSRIGGLNFILSNNGNQDFNVKGESCEFVDFVNDVDVIDCRWLKCVFCFRIQEKKKDTFYINFYSIIFLHTKKKKKISLFQLNNYNRYVCAIYN